jgi:prophage DNA circulation protein
MVKIIDLGKRKAPEPVNYEVTIREILEEWDTFKSTLKRIEDRQETIQRTIDGIFQATHRSEDSVRAIFEEIRDTLANLQVRHLPRSPKDNNSSSANSFGDSF